MHARSDVESFKSLYQESRSNQCSILPNRANVSSIWGKNTIFIKKSVSFSLPEWKKVGKKHLNELRRHMKHMSIIKLLLYHRTGIPSR